MKYENIKNFKAAKFKAVTGVTPETFTAMLEVVKTAYAGAHANRGRHRKLPQEDMLLMTLEYYKEYRTQECIGASYGLAKTNVGKVIKWVEEALIKSGLFTLPGKKKLLEPSTEIEVIVVDTTETPIHRPKNRQRHFYSGKKNDIL
jgi:hypothetical protein